MPELPEVETICRGLSPLLVGKKIDAWVFRRTQLRWPIPVEALNQLATGQRILALQRRGKYMLLVLQKGGVIFHLGMSGVLRWLDSPPPAGKHDHVDMMLSDGSCVRLQDPRRFGAILWWPDHPLSDHPLLAHLGVEPLSDACNGEALLELAAGRRVSLREFLMDSHRVVGIGNIYASEICFQAALNPRQPVAGLTLSHWQRVVAGIQQVLSAAIQQGGTTLKDYRNQEGRPGYFQQQLQVYGRAGQPCYRCGGVVETFKQGGRSGYFCPGCQIILK
ncbi:MAG: bifunctional DNA-formamidopyrimidine glycosylase/DNA-(apurinic or apyrimidinic site) lyase [Magnetococcales bacterium]|nr:bifunctional DNA-formamidopyrimidine glycosylase/DNA-(apurinic or apyrimidinic site) lyase [Magnetococcales bacterium]NGZ27602.1 bifunctional DNA-formamidopyrimidine glycosylase/DNA-(apurinic or apyrimidinic site) lyase [Magnetococcales bacterium]